MGPVHDGGNGQTPTEHVHMIPLNLTEAAKTRLIELSTQKEGAKGIILRIAKGKGCGGNEYKMEHMLAADEKGFDKITIGEGLALYIPVVDSFHMFNMTIDFESDEISNNRFLFQNPNEAGRCGCGESFSLDPNQKMDETGACGVE